MHVEVQKIVLSSLITIILLFAFHFVLVTYTSDTTHYFVFLNLGTFTLYCLFSSSPVYLLIITTQPQDQINIVPGTNLTFTVVASGGDLNYQWFKDGRRLTEDIKFTGTMNTTLTVIDVMDSDEGDYLCSVGNNIDTVLSMEVVLNTCK